MTVDQTTREQLLEARIRELEEASRDGFVGTFNPSDVDGLLAAPGKITSVLSGEYGGGQDVPVGKTIVYSTIDGEPRPINTNMLAKTLAKKIPGTNKRAFVHPDPETGRLPQDIPTYERGTVPCWFNPKSERFAELHRIPGLTTFECASEHLASEFDAEQHVKNRHSRRYGMAVDFLERKEREDERAIRREEIAAMRALAGGSRTAAPDIYACDAAGCTRFFDSDQGLKIHKSKEQH